MKRGTTAASDDRRLLAEQIEYYRARASEYDAWWSRTGRFDRGEANNSAWRADVTAAEDAVATMLATTRPSTVLELACGTGLFTRHLAPRAAVTAVDASPEVIAINRARIAGGNVHYIQADLFAWQPQARYDCVFMSFWLSHVPHTRFDAFWSMVRRALETGGFASPINPPHNPTSPTNDHPPPARQEERAKRKIENGMEFRIVKVFWTPERLTERLRESGFAADLAATSRYFVYGSARDARTE